MTTTSKPKATENLRVSDYERYNCTNCENPICIHNTTDEERAEFLKDYIRSLPVEPLLMPRTEDGKKPLIAEKEITLDSEKGQKLLVSPTEAIRRIREEGATGFCLYAGKPTHNTEQLVFADHDNMDKFPLDTLPDTLTVRSGSGEGYHETFLNQGVENAKGKEEYSGAGEIRASNWLVVTPGSVHPSGGIYHTVQYRDLATLSNELLPSELKQSQYSSGSDDEPVNEEDLEDITVDSDTVRIAQQYLNEWKTDNLSAFYCIKDRLVGGRGDYGTELSNENGKIDRDLQEKTILTHLYGVYRDLGYSDMRAKELAQNLLTHYCIDCNNGNTKDGRPRKWLKRGIDYRTEQLRYAALQFDREQFKRWTNKTTKAQTRLKRLNNEYSDITRGIALFVVDVMSGVYELDELSNNFYINNFSLGKEELNALVQLAKQESHMYNDIPRGEGNEVLNEENLYPKKTDVKTICKQVDGVYKGGNEESTYDEVLKRLQREGKIKIAEIKNGVDYRVYPSDFSNPENANWVKCGGEKIEPNEQPAKPKATI